MFKKLSDKVLDIRTTFKRMAVDYGVALADEENKKEELAAHISSYGNGSMEDMREEYGKEFMLAEMKEAEKAYAANKSRSRCSGGAASAGP